MVLKRKCTRYTLLLLKESDHMTVLDIIQSPNMILGMKAELVENFDTSLKRFINDMFDTMKAHNGIGLAAPQVGVLQRIFICKYKRKSLICINPTLRLFGDQIDGTEACLSIPGVEVNVSRYSNVEVSAFDMKGKPFKHVFSGMMAIIVQHEYDHLEGVLITDYIKNSLNFTDIYKQREE